MAKTLILVIFIVGSALVTFFYLMPEWNKFQDLRAEIAQQDSVNNELADILQVRDSLLTTMSSISPEDLERIDNIIPKGAQSPEYIALLEYLARNSGLVLKEMEVDAPPFIPGKKSGQPRPQASAKSPVSEDSIKEIPVEMTLAGTYASFRKFLSELERSARFTDVGDVSFGNAADPETETDAKGKTKTSGAPVFTIHAKTYYQ